MDISSSPASSHASARPSSPGRQLACALAGALVGGALWWALSVPQHLVNVVFSTLVGIGAGLAAGRFSGSARSAIGTTLTMVVTAVVVVATMAIVSRAYLDWATANLSWAPSHPSWEGPLGSVRLALDRATASNGWARSGTTFYWGLSLTLAGALSWYTAPKAPRTADGR
jgi:hypothetical protein